MRQADAVSKEEGEDRHDEAVEEEICEEADSHGGENERRGAAPWEADGGVGRKGWAQSVVVVDHGVCLSVGGGKLKSWSG